MANEVGSNFAFYSLGFSLLLPNLCISEARKSLLDTVNRLNDFKLSDKGVYLSYHDEAIFTSWIEMSIVEPNNPHKV